MKKIYKSLSFLAFVALSFKTTAQSSTTITATAIPQIGFSYNMLADTAAADLTTFTVSAGSASVQTWNYTPQFGNTYNDTTAFVIPSSGAGSSGFPSANLASKQGTTWAYLKNTSGLMIDGAYVNYMGTTNISLDFIPDAPQLPVPFTYGNTTTVSYNANTSFTYSSVPVQLHHHATRTVSADAFGSITTPTATYPNALRVRTYEVTLDSIIPPSPFPVTVQTDSTINYTWFQNSQNAFIMSIDMSGDATTVKKAEYLNTFVNSVSVISQPAASFNLFPNPTSEMAYLTYENKTSGLVTLTLTDVSGKQMAVLVNEQQNIGSQKMTLNIAAFHMPKGVYFLQLNSNNRLQTIKLSVN